MTRTQADVYYVRDKSGSWGYFFVHPNGIVMAYTDYGNYAHGWPDSARSEDIKSLLIGIRSDYLLEKMAERNVLDEEASRQNFIGSVLDSRRQKEISKERARELYDEILEADVVELVEWGSWQPEIGPDCYDWIVYDYSEQAKRFVKRLWPLFIEQLKLEQKGVNKQAPETAKLIEVGKDE